MSKSENEKNNQMETDGEKHREGPRYQITYQKEQPRHRYTVREMLPKDILRKREAKICMLR